MITFFIVEADVSLLLVSFCCFWLNHATPRQLLIYLITGNIVHKHLHVSIYHLGIHGG